ncbi:DsrE family protein [Thioalkalivibrio paradoxus]|uniref:DsrE family protein n=1 Tax=Thioalkalivibrio paradoxus TaxID=108010 RepID=UPI001E5A0DAE|nr:DsrE family protein [Thioalkalivibrio paradoxus]
MLLAAAAAGSVAWAGPGRSRVVYHVNRSDTETQRNALQRVQDHIDSVGAENLEIRVVLHGGGVDLLLAANHDAPIRDGIDALKLQGVRFEVCGHTLARRQIPVDALYDARDADVVHSGVARLSDLQRQGYIYVKP